MTSHFNIAGDIDNDLDDAALWAVIDSAAAAATLAASSAYKSRKPFSLQHPSPVPLPKPSPYARFPSPKVQFNQSDGEVLQGPSDHRPQKLAKFSSPCVSDLRSERSPTPAPLVMVKHVPQRTPRTPVVYSSPETRKYSVTDVSSSTSPTGSDQITVPLRLEEVENGSTMMRHSLSGQFPTVSLFKDYQNAAMAILEKSDCTVISGNPYIKKSGWRKIAFYFNISFEIKDKTIEFDENRDVQRAEFIVRGHMPGGRFADGWGSCERREKRFMKPNHDIPSTAETRAKNKACQDLLGIGEYRSGAKHSGSR